MPASYALLAEDIDTTSGEEHVSSPLKVHKVKYISAKCQQATPKLVVKQDATKCALLADEIATTSGEEHVASPPNVYEVKENICKGPKSCTKTSC